MHFRVATAPTGQSSDITKPLYYSTYNIGFVNPNPDVTNWSIQDGYYQLTVNPSQYTGIQDDLGDSYSYGDTSAQAQTMFYRLFGSAIGYDPLNGYVEVTQDDVFFFRNAYEKTQPGQVNQVTDFAKWSFFCYFDPNGNNGVPNQITADDQTQMRSNIGARLTIPTPRSFP